METAKYILVNECSLTMNALESTLTQGTTLACDGKYNTLAALLEALPHSEARAVIVDRFLVGDAPAAFAGYFQNRSDVRLIVFCPNDCTRLDPLPLITLGVLGILGSDTTPAEFEKAVCGDDYHYNQWLTPKHFRQALHAKRDAEKKEALFTAREMDVLRLLCQDKTTKEIAECLFLSERTIEKARQQLMQKTQSHTVAGLIKFALQNGLIK